MQTPQPELGDVALMLKGYGLTTAEFTYRIPDYQRVLSIFTLQFYDVEPKYPKLHEFIDFWRREIEGPLHSVRFTHQKLIRPGEWRNAVGEFRIH